MTHTPNTTPSLAALSQQGSMPSPSPSALRVAKARAVHQLLDEPIVLPDPWALPILGDEMAQALQDDPFVLNDPVSRGLRAGVVVRSRYAEDALAQALPRGVTQCVVLGAGLDTLGLRNPAPERLRMFEVDHPVTQSWKRELLARLTPIHNALPPITFVPLDLAEQPLLPALQEAGLDLQTPTFVSWLGVSVYLPNEVVLDTLLALQTLPSGSEVMFDYAVVPERLNPLEQMMVRFSAQAFAAQGEPWQSAFEPEALHRVLREWGYRELEDVGPEELNPRYFHRRRDGLQTSGGGFRFLRAVR